MVRFFLILLLIGGLWFYFFTQGLIGNVVPSTCLIGDRLQALTASGNAFLLTHPNWANGLIILYATLGDIYLLFFFIAALWTRSFRMAIPLFVFLAGRQIVQLLVTLPLPEHLIWHYPGFPALFASYNITHDFYFSAYIGINLLVTLELLKYRIKWLTIVGFLIVTIEAIASVLLRIHFTTDIYTSIIFAIFIYLYVSPLSDRIGEWVLRRFTHVRLLLVGFFAVSLAIFYSVQHWIGKKGIAQCGITDLLLTVSLPINAYISEHPSLSDGFLMVMNGLTDVLGVFLIALVIFKKDSRPFLMLLIFGLLRQTLQYLVSLPIPLHAIWHDPGFPTIFATYGVINDFYFSLHTGVSLIAALELIRFRKWGLTLLGFAIFIFEACSVIVLQIHYTMDVFTAIITVFCISKLCDQLGRRLNQGLEQVALYFSNLRIR